MSKIKFTDGVEFNTSGPLRMTRRHDGLYVVGNGMLIPVSDAEEARAIIVKSLESPRVAAARFSAALRRRGAKRITSTEEI